MKNQQKNIDIFQFLFIDQEIVPFIEAVKQCAKDLQNKICSLEPELQSEHSTPFIRSLLLKKNLIFEYCFKFDLDRMRTFSRQISTLFINDFQHFKKKISIISFRIIKGILSKRIQFQSPQMNEKIEKIIDSFFDRCQVRISIEPYNLPFDDLGFHSLDDSISIHHYVFITGRISNVENPQHLIIRRLYKCRNPECKNIFYINYSNSFPNTTKSISCPKCDEKAFEDESGRIIGSCQQISLYPIQFSHQGSFFSETCINYNYFSFFPQISFKIKDYCEKSNFECSELLTVGHVVDVVATANKHNARIIREPNYESSTNDSFEGDTENSRNYFCHLMSLLEKLFPIGKLYKQFYRIATATLCSIASSSQILFVVESVEDMKLLVQFLTDTLLEPGDCDVYHSNEKLLFSSKQQKQPPAILSRKTIVITHLEDITSKNRDKLNRIISQKSVCGYSFGLMTLIGVLVSPEFDAAGISLFDSFPIVLRVDQFPVDLFVRLYFTESNCSEGEIFHHDEDEIRLCLNIRSEYKNVVINEESQALIDAFLEFIENDEQINSTLGMNISPETIVLMCKAMATLHDNQMACEHDAVFAIYFFMERLVAVSGLRENLLNQFPCSSLSFFSNGISSIPTNDESVLFTCFRSILFRMMKNE